MPSKAVLDLLKSVEQEAKKSESYQSPPEPYVDPDIEADIEEVISEDFADRETEDFEEPMEEVQGEESESEDSEPPRPLPTFEIRGSIPWWRKVVKALDAVYDEIPITFPDPITLQLKAIDPGHILMVDLRITPYDMDPKDWVPPEGMEPEAPYGIYLDALKSFLKGLKVKEGVVLEFVDRPEGEGRFVIRTEYPLLEDTIKPVDVEGVSIPKIPKLEMEGAVEVRASELKQAIKAMEEVATDVKMTLDPNEGFEIESNNSMRKKVARWDRYMVERLDVSKRVKSYFPLHPLLNILAPFDKETLTVELGEDYPMRLKGRFSDCEVTFLLAPRIYDE